ncbi:putative integral membrane protein [Teratosphaeria destructans]|uniref:Integral membrane protein n=1 Tax=Teratosphaeria destructans TaxID=418781 RepID=A0A9W7SXU8_9PEZI|nr:putative integral membrane protein [Teratosphaeria destructans]
MCTDCSEFFIPISVRARYCGAAIPPLHIPKSHMEKRHGFLAVSVVFFVSSWFTICLRIYVRAYMLRSWGRDDWTMVASQILFTAYLIGQIGIYVHGGGLHMWVVSASRRSRAIQYLYAVELLYQPTNLSLKFAIGFFILRVARDKRHRIIIYTVLTVSCLHSLAFIIVLLQQCHPISAYWDTKYVEGHYCTSLEILLALNYALSAVNIVTDWTIAILPIFIVRKTQMPPFQKRSVAIIFALGALGSAATIIRLPFIGGLQSPAKRVEEDYIYNVIDALIWTIVEVGLGATAANIATLWPLLRGSQRVLTRKSSDPDRRRLFPERPPSRLGILPSIEKPMPVLLPDSRQSAEIRWEDGWEPRPRIHDPAHRLTSAV